jgi:hypothetical protein
MEENKFKKENEIDDIEYKSELEITKRVYDQAVFKFMETLKDMRLRLIISPGLNNTINYNLIDTKRNIILNQPIELPFEIYLKVFDESNSSCPYDTYWAD